MQKEHFEVVEAATLRLLRTKEHEVDPVHGTRSHHHFEPEARGVLQMRWLSCYCTHCRAYDCDFDATKCVNKAYVGGWKLVTVKKTGRFGVAGHRQEAQERSALGFS